MPDTGNGTKKRFLGGVAVLLPATLFAKIIGLFYKIPLLHIVGVEGMAYFLSAYHVYSLLFVLAASGLPTALSLLIAGAVASGEGRSVGRMLRVALLLFLGLGLLGMLSLSCFAERIATGLSMGEAAPALVAIAPALLLSAFTGAARGWFQGHREMWPTAVSEVLEAGGKLGFGLVFAALARKGGRSTPEIAAAAIFGITVGVGLSALFLLFAMLARRYPRTGHRITCLSRRQVLLTLIRVALPVTVSASVMSLVSLVDTALISSRLQAAGYAPSVANALYSCYGNLAVPLYNLLPSLLSPVALALTPALSAAVATNGKGDEVGVFSSALRIGALAAIPASLGLAVFSEPLLRMLYGSGEAAVGPAAPLLALLAPAVLPAVFISITAAALQARGAALFPVLSMLAGAAVKLAVEALLLSVPSVGIPGAPISTLCCNLTVLFLNGVALHRKMPHLGLSGGLLLRPLAAAVFAVGGGVFAYGAVGRMWGAHPLQMPLTLAVTALLYGVLALRLRAVEREDLLSLPGGDRLTALLEKCKLLKEKEQDDERGKIGADLKKGSL